MKNKAANSWALKKLYIQPGFELIGMQKASEAVACTLKEMTKFAQPGITTKELDEYGAKILADFGASSAPKLTYGFLGGTMELAR